MPFDDRAVVLTLRRVPAREEPEVWITVHDGPEVRTSSILRMVGPLEPDDLPFHLPDALRDTLDYAHSLAPRMF